MNTIKKLFNRLFLHDKWAVGLIELDYAAIIREQKLPSITTWLEAKTGEYIADPFIYKYQDEYFLFYELFTYIKGDADIAVCRLIEQDGQWQMQGEKVILAEPFHQSYPYLFEYEGEIYCTPEQSEGNRVKLYKALDFPYQWQDCGSLIEDFPVVDPSIFKYQDKWWLLASKGSGEQDNSLYLWTSDNPLSGWKRTQDQAIKTGLGQCRPAGTPFEVEGKLYRPIQAFKQRYGDGLLIGEIKHLSAQGFDEEIVFEISPDAAYPHGLHHLSLSGTKAVVDGKRYANLWEVGLKLLGILLRKLRKS